MSTRSGPGEHASEVGKAARDLAGAMRRMVISLASQALWQVTGHTLLDETKETRDAEVFGAIGFASRPPASGGTPEAIVAMVGGPQNPTIIASRDETTRRSALGSLVANFAAIFNSVAVLKINPDGTITATSIGGVAVALALKSDVQTVISKYNGHTHAVATTGTATTQTGTAAVVSPADRSSNPTGTSVLKGM